MNLEAGGGGAQRGSQQRRESTESSRAEQQWASGAMISGLGSSSACRAHEHLTVRGTGTKSEAGTRISTLHTRERRPLAHG